MADTGIRALLSRDRATLAVVATLFVMVTINQLGTGIVSAVIPVRLAADGYSASAAGAISTVFSACFLVGCLIGPRIVGRLGANGTLLLIAATHATLALLHWTFPGPFAWSLFRGVAGLATATYFVLVESWVSSQTTPATRGLIFGVYMVLIRIAIAAGQLIIVFADPASLSNLFLVAAAIYVISPLFRPRVTSSAPPAAHVSLATYLDLPRLAPAAAAAAMSHGLLFATVPALLPKWGVEAGLSIAAIATTLAVTQLGGLLLQVPLSFLSDRVERRTIMLLATSGAAAVTVLVMHLPPTGSWMWLALMLVWGGFASPLYSLGLAHASDIAPPEQRVAWVSSLLLIWGIGAMLGPVIAAGLMDLLGTRMLWVYGLTVSLGMSTFFVWRKVVRPRT